eukprot:g20695.t1
MSLVLKDYYDIPCWPPAAQARSVVCTWCSCSCMEGEKDHIKVDMIFSFCIVLMNTFSATECPDAQCYW